MFQLDKLLEKIRREKMAKRPKREPRKRRLADFAAELMKLKEQGRTCVEMRRFLLQEKDVVVCRATIYRFLKLLEKRNEN